MRYHITVNGKSLAVDLISRQGPTLTFSVAGEHYTTTIKPDLTPNTNAGNPTEASQRTGNELRAPMPGIIVSIEASEGEIVPAGGTALIVEAMKMENNITVATAVRVTRIHVAVGDEVDTGQLLIELEAISSKK
jgi:biotin carboxyl carrier protein